MGKLDNLNQQVRTCRLCRLCRMRINGVPGEGSESAEILFIGEGPGFNEDRDGRPFVGQAGQFLDELLQLAGLQRPAVYITNVVKCRPPQNRDPLPDEIDACAPYLERQIATIDPLLIVTLGRYSMARFFPNDKISSVHGQARTVEGRVVMTMWHPAYGLRDARGRESLKEDFARVPAVLEQAREMRASRKRGVPLPAFDYQALIDQQLETVAAAVPEAPAAAPANGPALEVATAPVDNFAYVAAVNGKKRGRPRKTPVAGASDLPAPVAAAPDAVAVAEVPVSALVEPGGELATKVDNVVIIETVPVSAVVEPFAALPGLDAGETSEPIALSAAVVEPVAEVAVVPDEVVAGDPILLSTVVAEAPAGPYAEADLPANEVAPAAEVVMPSLEATLRPTEELLPADSGNGKPRRARRRPAAPAAVLDTTEAGAPPATTPERADTPDSPTQAGKQDKPDPGFKQLSLF